MAKILAQKLLPLKPQCLAYQFQSILAPSKYKSNEVGHYQTTAFRAFHVTSNLFSDTYYTESHEWIRIDKNNGTIGITDYAQEQLGDIAYCDLPEDGVSYNKGECFATIESVKAASDLFMPVTAKVTESNRELKDHPALINESPLDKGWIAKVTLTDAALSDVKTLLDKAAYEKMKSNADEH